MEIYCPSIPMLVRSKNRKLLIWNQQKHFLNYHDVELPCPWVRHEATISAAIRKFKRWDDSSIPIILFSSSYRRHIKTRELPSSPKQPGIGLALVISMIGWLLYWHVLRVWVAMWLRWILSETHPLDIRQFPGLSTVRSSEGVFHRFSYWLPGELWS